LHRTLVGTQGKGKSISGERGKNPRGVFIDDSRRSGKTKIREVVKGEFSNRRISKNRERMSQRPTYTLLALDKKKYWRGRQQFGRGKTPVL